MNFKYQLALLTMMWSCLIMASAQNLPLTEKDLQTPPDGIDLPQCDENILSQLKFILNGEVVGEELLLSPPIYRAGQYIDVKLQEDLRVCKRHTEVDLWLAIEMPNGTRFFLTRNQIGFPEFILYPSALTLLPSEVNAHTIVNFEVPATSDFDGVYYLYAIYTLAGKDISDCLFSLRSNRAVFRFIIMGGL